MSGMRENASLRRKRRKGQRGGFNWTHNSSEEKRERKGKRKEGLDTLGDVNG